MCGIVGVGGGGEGIFSGVSVGEAASSLSEGSSGSSSQDSTTGTFFFFPLMRGFRVGCWGGEGCIRPSASAR